MKLKNKLLYCIQLSVCVSVLTSLSPARASLIFSEYIEGSSYNKALEIFNSGSAIDFDSDLYSIEIYTNGSNTVSRTINLSGSIATNATFVVVNNRADSALTDVSDLLDGSLNFNGDDAIILKQNSSVVDSIGQIGVDPGTGWGRGATSTFDATLRRSSAILVGDIDPLDGFDPALEWAGFAIDDFSGLGAHTYTSASSSPRVSSRVPEPATLLLLLLGITVLFYSRNKSQRHCFETVAN